MISKDIYSFQYMFPFGIVFEFQDDTSFERKISQLFLPCRARTPEVLCMCGAVGSGASAQTLVN